MHIAALFAASLALCLASALAMGRNCPATQSFVIGSFNDNPFRPFNGTGVTILRQSNMTISKSLVIPPSTAGNNPTYAALFRKSLIVSNSAFPSGTLTQLSFSSAPPYLLPPVRAPVPDATRASHVGVVEQAGLAFISNTFGGTVASFDARTLKLLDTYTVPVELASGVVPRRQGKPGPHMAYVVGRQLIVPDLGADSVFIFRFGARRGRQNFGKLTLTQTVRLDGGDGPRHVVHHPPSGSLFVVNELSQTLVTLCRKKGAMYERCGTKLDLLDEGPFEGGLAAAIRLSRTSNFLYASVRRDSRDDPIPGIISGFRVSKRGMITKKLGQWSSGGAHPRDFNIVYDLNVNGMCRNYIAAANRDSDNVVFFRLHYDGTLGDAEFTVPVGGPSLVLQL